MDWCDLHTILRLPTGIFYAQGVKTNVLFFTRGESGAGQHASGLDLRPARRRAGLWEDRPLIAERISPISSTPSATIRTAWRRAPTGAGRPLPPLHPRRDRRPRRQSRHLLAARRGRRFRGAADRAGGYRRAIMGHLRAALEEVEALTAGLEAV